MPSFSLGEDREKVLYYRTREESELEPLLKDMYMVAIQILIYMDSHIAEFSD